MNTALRRSFRAGTAITTGALVLGAGLAACGTVEQLNAGEKVSGAFEKLGNSKSLQIDLSVDATSDQLVAFGEAVDDPIERKAADLLSDLTLSVSMSADKPLKDMKGFKNGCAAGESTTDGIAVGYALNSKKSGKSYADIRLIGDTMYLKADVRGIAELAGEDPSGLDAGLDTLPPEAAPIKDVLNGKWVALDVKKFRELAGQAPRSKDLGRGAAAPQGAAGIDPSVLNGVCESVKSALADNITLEDKGKSGDADVVRMSAPARPLVKSLVNSFTKVAESIPGYPALPTEDDFSDVPDRKISADVLIKDGRAQAVTVDLAQFEDNADPAAHLPVRLGFSNSTAALTAPSGATQLDLTKLQDAFAAMSGGGYPDDEEYDSSDYTSPGTPLTESQYAQLEQLGVDRATADAMNQGGLEFAEIKDMAPQLSA